MQSGNLKSEIRSSQICREEDYPRNIPVCYVLDNGDSYSGLPGDVDQAVRFLFPGILVLVLLPMLHDYFNGCARARSLGIAAQIKIMREPSLILSGLFVRLPSENYKIVCWKRKSLKTLKICLFSFRLYFVIFGDSLCIFIMYYLRYIWY